MSPYCICTTSSEVHHHTYYDMVGLTFSSLAALCLSPYLRNLGRQAQHVKTQLLNSTAQHYFLKTCPRCWMKLAPGCFSGPFTTNFLIRSMLARVTCNMSERGAECESNQTLNSVILVWCVDCEGEGICSTYKFRVGQNPRHFYRDHNLYSGQSETHDTKHTTLTT